MAKSPEDQCSRAPRSWIFNQCDEIWITQPLLQDLHQTQWVIGHKYDILAESIRSDPNLFRKAGVIVSWEGSSVLSLKKVPDPAELVAWLFYLEPPTCRSRNDSRGSIPFHGSPWGYTRKQMALTGLCLFDHWSDTFRQPCVGFISTTTRPPNCATETVRNPRSSVSFGWTICHLEKGKGEDTEYCKGPERALTFWLVGNNGF